MTAEINPAIRLYIKSIYFSYFSLQKYLHLYIFYRNSSEKEISMLKTNSIQPEISKRAGWHFTPAPRKENMPMARKKQKNKNRREAIRVSILECDVDKI